MTPSTEVAATSSGPASEAPECLERLREALGASQVTLMKLEREAGAFRVVGIAGLPLLAASVTLPVAASSVALAASEGRSVSVALDGSARPLDRMVASLGMRSCRGIPLSIGGFAVGAVSIAWDVETPAGDDPRAAVASHEAELVASVLSQPVKRGVVLVCHEDRLAAEGMARTVERRLGARAEVACSFAEAKAMLKWRRPDLIVCSDHLCPEHPLPEVARRLRLSGAAAPLLVLARTDSARSLRAAIEAGATGYVAINEAGERLAAAATAVLDGNSALPTEIEPSSGPRLTEREYQVLAGFEQGLSDKEIALQLGVALSTAKTHARAIYSKLGAQSRTGALYKAKSMRLI